MSPAEGVCVRRLKFTELLGTAFGVAAAAALPASAQASDGYVHTSTMETAVLARECAADIETDLSAKMCVSYVLGVYDAMSTFGAICPGPGSSTLMAVVIGRRALAANPADWDKGAAFLLGQAFKRAFPCRTRSRP